MKSINFFLKIFSIIVGIILLQTPLSALDIGLSISDATIVEGDSGTSNLTFTVSSSASAGSNITFNYATADGTAVAGSDYTATSGTGTITAGTSSTTISVPIIGDLTQEGTETFTVNITSSTPIYDGTGVGTITDNDTRSLSIADVTVTEGDSGTSNATLTLTLSGNTASVALPFTYSTANGTAIGGSDFTAKTNVTASIPAGASTATITIPIMGDTIVENTEAFTVNIASTSVPIGDSSAEVTINDNDKYTLTLSPTTQSTTEGNSGTTNAPYTVTLNQTPLSNVTFYYTTQNDTATAGSDYTTTSGSYTFAAGTTTLTKTFNVPIIGDTVAEDHETYTFYIYNPSSNAQLGTSTATGTITNDDSGTLSISQSGTSVAENGGSKTYTVTLSATPTSNVTVNYATGNGTATAGSDYTTKSGTLTFNAGTTTLSQTFSVPILDDSIQENDETYTVSLSNPANATITTSSVTTTITDDDGRTLSISPVTHTTTEGNSGTTDATYTVTLSGTPLNNVTVHYATANGTAAAGSDYTATSGNLTFAAGTTTLTQTITVPIIGDTTPEQNENFRVTLSSASGATIATSTATETIEDDDLATLSINSVSTTEGDSSYKNLTFTVTLSAKQSDAVTVHWATSDGTATTANNDYRAASGNLTFSAGQTSKTISIRVYGDTIQEQDELFYVTLSSPSNAQLGTAVGTGTILNNDQIYLSISPDTQTVEGNSGTKNAVYTVTLSGTPANDVTVNYATADGTANAVSDYTAQSGTFTFPAGTTTLTKTINVPIIGDTAIEPDETYTVNLSGATNATISTGSVTGTILNDDTSISINDVTVLEPPCFDGTATLTVTLAQAVNYAVTVGYSTSNGTATAGANADYNSASGSITIPAGSTTGTISVTIHPDALVELAETFNVTITNSAGITITKNIGVVTINDNQNRNITLFPDQSITEGDSGTAPMPFTVTLCYILPTDVSVHYATADNSAKAGNDYTASSGTLTIPAGSLTGTFSVPIIGDLIQELTETFYVNLSSPSSGVTINDSQAIGTIYDNDNRTISINDTTVTEENSGTTPATLTISMSQAASTPVTVNYSTQNGTATTADSDYISSTGSVTFATGETSKTISLTVNGDTKVEGNEYFDVNISTASGVTVSDNSGRVTINDDDNRTLTLGGTSTYTEGDTNHDINLTVTLNSVSPVDRTLKYSTVNVSAMAGSDFIGITNQSVTIPAGTTSVNLPVTIIGDLVYESTKTFRVTITSDDGFALSGSPRTVTINDDDGRLSINDQSLTEGDSGTKPMAFTVSLNRAMNSDVIVTYATSDNTATVADNDYVATSGTLTIPAGQLLKTFDVTINGDTKYEPNETFNLTIGNAQGVTVYDSTGIGTIQDDDARTVTLNSPSYAETEANVSRPFTVTLSGSRLLDTNLTYVTSDGTAMAGSDYIATSGSIIIPAGSTTETINVTTIGDYVNEPNETFTLTLSTTESGVTIPVAGIMTIQNDDGNLSIVGSVSMAETNSSSYQMPFNVTLTQAMSSPVTVSYGTSDGNASSTGAYKDYEATSGTITFNPGETTKTIYVTIYGDMIYEGTEYFNLNISNAQGVLIDNAASRGYIVEDDGRSVTIADGSANEGDTGTITSYITTSLSMISGSDANISYTVSDGSALISDNDFIASSGSVIIPAGSLSAQIPIVHYGDLKFEPNETVTVSIATSTPGFVVTDNTGIFTLVNDDGVLRIGDLTAQEGNTSTTTTKDINITLSHASTVPIIVNYETSDGTAIAGSDYVAVSGSVTISAGSTLVSIPVTVLGDAITEGNEYFYVNITNDQNVTIDDNNGTVTIIDDDIDAMEIFDHQREFSRRFGKNLYGNYVSTGAPIMCALNSTGTACDWNYSGSLAASVTRYLQEDVAIANNSSSANLDIPMDNGDKILFAGLYWQGHIESNVADDLDNNTSGWNTIIFKTPDGIAHSITADLGDENQTNYYAFQAATSATYDGFRFFYQGFADVTDEVNASLNNNLGRTFTVGDMKATTGGDHIINDPALDNGNGFGRVGHFGGWSLVVVYEKGDKTNPDDLRNVSIFDGYKYLVAGTQDLSTPEDETVKSIDISISGFRTPSSIALGEEIDSTLLYFGGGSEKVMVGDEMDVSNKSGEFLKIHDSINPVDNPFNDSISHLGNYINTLRVYNPGIDLDTIQISQCLDENNLTVSCMDTNQSSTTIRLSAVYTVGSDQAFAGVVGFSTQLYQPQLCYDFTYKQNGVYLKNDVGEREIPTIQGVVTSAPIQTGIYLKNTDSDFPIEGLSLYTDMNQSKISYVSGTIQTTKTNGTVLKMVTESEGCSNYESGSGGTVACYVTPNVRVGLGTNTSGYTKDKAGYLGSGDFVFTEFTLDPFALSGDVNESIGLKINYYIDLGDGEIPYEYTLGRNVKLCPPSPGYAPSWGQFNVIDSSNKNGELADKNNLYTQVAKKPFNTDVAFYASNGGLYNIPPSSEVNSTVLIEIIDADAYHDINASCANPSAAITNDPIYVEINATSADNTESVPIQTADYYNFAVKNAAYRVWYFDDGDGALIQNWTVDTDSNGRNVERIHDLYQPGKHIECTASCGDPTSTTCFECLKENYAHPICSRDNFAIRPESFDIRIHDVNQTNSAVLSDLSLTAGYAPTSSSAVQLKLAAGYQYSFDINATNHTDLEATPGYTRYYSGTNNDYNATMVWNSTKTLAECNNIDGTSLTFDLINGAVYDTNESNNNVGEYLLQMVDKGWTAVDWRDTSHHTVANNFNTTSDCIENDSSTLGLTNGCVVTTSGHTNGLFYYKDHNLRFFPYKFDLSSMMFTRGLVPVAIDTMVGARNFIYMADIANNSDMNMSLRITGNIIAEGYNGDNVSNFVSGCYAQDVNISMDYTLPDQNLTYKGRLIATDPTIVYDTNATILNGNSNLFILGEGNFTKTQNGATAIIARFNYDRNISKAVNPARVDFNNLNVSCSDITVCQLNADNLSTKIPEGNTTMNFGITHYFGRAQGMDSRIKTDGPNDNTAEGYTRINFEIFCGNDGNTSCTTSEMLLLPDGQNTPHGEGRNWYKNRDHSISNDGVADTDGVIERKSGSGTVSVSTATSVSGSGITIGSTEVGFQRYGATYNGDKGYPHTVILQNIPSSWLIYDPNNPNVTGNEFSVEFYKASNWIGEEKIGTVPDTDASVNTSRRIMW